MSFRVKLKIEKNRADLEYIRSKIYCKISDLTGKIEKTPSNTIFSTIYKISFYYKLYQSCFMIDITYFNV